MQEQQQQIAELKQNESLQLQLDALERGAPVRANANPPLDTNSMSFGAVILGALAFYRAQKGAAK